MKKIIALILFCSIMLLTFGCQAPEDPIINADTTDPNNTAEPTKDQIIDIIPENLYSVSLPMTYQYFSSDTSDVLFEYAYPTMYLTVPDSEVADKIIVDFLNKIDGTHADAQNIQNQAVSDYSAANQWVPYSYQVTYNPTRIDQGVLSLYGQAVHFSGGSHSNRTCISANYDMVTGDVMTLGSILYHLDTKDDLCNLVIQKLNEQKESLQLYSDFQESVVDHFNADESHFEAFFFTTTGLNFYFAPYEIAPYASGSITVEIPYAQLTGIIDDQYFPAERQTTSGDISAHLFSSADLDQYEQFAEIITDEGGEKIILSTDGIIYNIRIYAGVWDLDGTVFTITNTVFAANVLSATDAIMLETFIPDAAPNLMISFDGGDIPRSYYILQSGEDGSIILENVQ